jgi:hypothetical protein
MRRWGTRMRSQRRSLGPRNGAPSSWQHRLDERVVAVGAPALLGLASASVTRLGAWRKDTVSLSEDGSAWERSSAVLCLWIRELSNLPGHPQALPSTQKQRDDRVVDLDQPARLPR